MFSMKCCRKVLLLNYSNKHRNGDESIATAMRIATAMQQETAEMSGAYSKWPLQKENNTLNATQRSIG